MSPRKITSEPIVVAIGCCDQGARSPSIIGRIGE
jgi:hypothetical protein